jgi:GntR family transcriptional repressor for pyruvate dehydrogenase complex
MPDLPITPLTSMRVFEQVSDQIRKLILTGIFKPGDKLPPEKELAVQFNVGRAALREALRVLEGEGLIHVKQGSEGGSFINQPDILTTPKSIIEQIRERKLDPSQIRELRLALEVNMLEHVLARMSDDDLIQMEKTIDDAQKQLQRGDVPVSDISAFHLVIAKASRNPLYEMLLRSMVNIGIHTLAMGANRRDFLGSHLAQHRKILAALKDRNLAKAKKALEDHILSITDNMQKSLDGTQKKVRSEG